MKQDQRGKEQLKWFNYDERREEVTRGAEVEDFYGVPNQPRETKSGSRFETVRNLVGIWRTLKDRYSRKMECCYISLLQ